MSTKFPEGFGAACRAIDSGDVAAVRRLLAEHPALKDYSDCIAPSWLHKATRDGASIEMMRMLLDLGLNVNKTDEGGQDTPLTEAVGGEHLEAAHFLLSRGADPNLGRPLIGAINIESDELALAFVKLLVEHGADVNRSFPVFGSQEVAIEPLTWAEGQGKTAIADYLRSKGAVAPEGSKPVDNPAPPDLDAEVVAYFQEHFGLVRPGALIEIVPVEPPIAVHCVPAGDGRDCITLFTTGMSEHAMTVPDGQEDYQYAELFVQLPAGWPLTKKLLGDPKHGWPIHWLRQIAKYPHQQQTWLGAPATLFANGDPPRPLAPHLGFTTWLLLPEFDFVSRERRKVQLYRLVPLYTEERELELKKGLPALLRALDRNKVSFVVDLRRKNVARP